MGILSLEENGKTLSQFSNSELLDYVRRATASQRLRVGSQKYPDSVVELSNRFEHALELLKEVQERVDKLYEETHKFHIEMTGG